MIFYEKKKVSCTRLQISLIHLTSLALKKHSTLKQKNPYAYGFLSMF